MLNRAMVWPVLPPDGLPAPPTDYEGDIPGTMQADVVGPVCETSDFLAKNRALPPMQRGDLLATFSAGAYGMSMASNYNSRPRAAEVLVAVDRQGGSVVGQELDRCVQGGESE